MQEFHAHKLQSKSFVLKQHSRFKEKTPVLFNTIMIRILDRIDSENIEKK